MDWCGLSAVAAARTEVQRIAYSALEANSKGCERTNHTGAKGTLPANAIVHSLCAYCDACQRSAYCVCSIVYYYYYYYTTLLPLLLLLLLLRLLLLLLRLLLLLLLLLLLPLLLLLRLLLLLLLLLTIALLASGLLTA